MNQKKLELISTYVNINHQALADFLRIEVGFINFHVKSIFLGLRNFLLRCRDAGIPIRPEGTDNRNAGVQGGNKNGGSISKM